MNLTQRNKIIYLNYYLNYSFKCFECQGFSNVKDKYSLLANAQSLKFYLVNTKSIQHMLGTGKSCLSMDICLYCHIHVLILCSSSFNWMEFNVR